MSRVLLTVEYDGTAYAGWQRQINGLSVQQMLEEALSELCKEQIKVTGASRTDARVHARGQRAHFDTQCHIPPDKYPFALNTMLPPDIRVTEGTAVPDGFHARFMTCGKLYTYRIYNKRHASALLRNTHLHVPVPLSEEPMQRAVKTLLGTHDFAAFQAAGGTAKTTVRTMREVNLVKTGDGIVFTIYGGAFLYNMVRIMVGTLIEIGHEKLSDDAFLRSYQSLNRLDLGPTAPPHGLELTRVDYIENAFEKPELVRWHEEKEE